MEESHSQVFVTELNAFHDTMEKVQYFFLN